jgi:hypothetical protein
MNYIVNTENRLPYKFKWFNRTEYIIPIATIGYSLETFKTELANKLNLITGLTFVVTSNVIGSITKINIMNENNLFKLFLGNSGSGIIAEYIGFDAFTPNYYTKIISSTKNPKFTQILNENNNTIVIQVIRELTYTLPIQIYSSIEKLMDMIYTGMNSTISGQNYSYSINNNIITFNSPNNPIILCFGEIEMFKLAKLLGFFSTNSTDYSSTVVGNKPYYLAYQLSDISFDLGTTFTITQIELNYISIDNLIYNINSRNNIFKFILKNTTTNVETTYSLSLLEGIYTPQDYIEKLNFQFISNSLSVTASYSVINQKISITCSLNFTIKYIDNTYTNKLLGLNNNSNRTFATVLTSDYVVNFEKNKIVFMEFNNDPTKRFFIEIEQMSKLPIILNWNNTISKLDISLKDEFGDPMNIQGNWIAILNFI